MRVGGVMVAGVEFVVIGVNRDGGVEERRDCEEDRWAGG